MALGSEEVTLYDLVAAYTVFANNGVRCEPYFITRIEDRDGELLEENRPRADAVAAPEDAYIVTNMMEGVLETGTGKTARQLGFKAPAAGKTGTTDYYTDGWFVGFTPSLAAGVWVGFDLKNPLGDKMTGARVALPTWTRFMMLATEGNEDDVFPIPPGIVRVEICSESGLLPTANCPHTVTEVFKAGNEPHEHCDIHSELSLIRARTEESFRTFDSSLWDEELEPPPPESTPATPRSDTP
jgi:penicillin-binding protein 1A